MTIKELNPGDYLVTFENKGNILTKGIHLSNEAMLDKNQLPPVNKKYPTEDDIVRKAYDDLHIEGDDEKLPLDDYNVTIKKIET